MSQVSNFILAPFSSLRRKSIPFSFSLRSSPSSSSPYPRLSLRFPISSPPPPSLRFRFTSLRTMASHIVGYPRMGPKRELKFALESFWDGKSTAEDLKKVAQDLRSSIWKQMSEAGIKYIPSNTFSYYDQMLDTTAMLGAVPARYGWNGGEIGFDVYFSMARGNASVPAMEMTKWFDTNYHYIVPELGPDVKFSYASHKAVEEYKEAKALGVDTVPVLVGPVSYLLLSKPAKGVEKNFSLLSLLDKIIPIYKQVVSDLKAAGASWIQFDEPKLVMDLETHELEAFTRAYSELETSLTGLNALVETYFADVPADAYKVLTSLKGVTGFGFDLVRGSRTIEQIKGGFPSGKYLFAGVVDGRNIWANDLAASLESLQALQGIVGKEKLVVSSSCSLLHTAVDLVNETKLDKEIKSWLAFAAQKVLEVNALAKDLTGQRDEAFFAANATALASRKSSPRVTNEAVQNAAAALKGSDRRRPTTVSARLDAQQKKLNLPSLPTTTIGSFPQTMELRKARREYKAKKISEEEYVNSMKEEISKVVKIQEELDIDVLVHGEPERNDMVEYFGEQLSGFAFTANGWVQSYGSRCVKPPIIYGDVSRPKAMTVFWSSTAQSMTKRPMKGMLTGPVTILNWSFVRNDQPRHETCYQIALAIKDEVEDLERAGITVIQIDEAALREGSDEKLLSVFREGVKYGAGIGPGVYDIHSPRIPSTEEIADRVRKMLAVLESNVLWVNPDCGLKTRKYDEVKPALSHMVAAAKELRAELAKAKSSGFFSLKPRIHTKPVFLTKSGRVGLMQLQRERSVKHILRMCKAKLQELCQKRRWDSPQYSAMRDGPDHNPRFKASVFINGLFFHSPPSCFSLKEAQNRAALAAFESLSSSPLQQEVDFASGIYKNLLQELIMRKKKLHHQPCYRTLMTGPSHLPTFFSSVSIGSVTFSGEAGYSKKAAEMNAAKVAYTALKLAFDHESPPSGSPETVTYLTASGTTQNQTMAEDSSLHAYQKKRKTRTV
ncbi:5-methyltetrahydropteroyltriglutamate--homocysteine methyltransferase [Linum grandiflorum]